MGVVGAVGKISAFQLQGPLFDSCNGLVSSPGGVKDSHPINTTETGDKCRLHGPLGS